MRKAIYKLVNRQGNSDTLELIYLDLFLEKTLDWSAGNIVNGYLKAPRENTRTALQLIKLLVENTMYSGWAGLHLYLLSRIVDTADRTYLQLKNILELILLDFTDILDQIHAVVEMPLVVYRRHTISTEQEKQELKARFRRNLLSYDRALYVIEEVLRQIKNLPETEKDSYVFGPLAVPSGLPAVVHIDSVNEEFISENAAVLQEQFGGKGANMMVMNSLGLKVPSGFVIPIVVSRYKLHETYPEEFNRMVLREMKVLEANWSKKHRGLSGENSLFRFNPAIDELGEGVIPLLVSVRPGSILKMPGSLPTIINIGVNDKIAEFLAKKFNPRFAYDTYSRFLESYAEVVYGIPNERFSNFLEIYTYESGVSDRSKMNVRQLKMLCDKFKNLIAGELEIMGQDSGVLERDLANPLDQLRKALKAVLNSWEREDAFKYRACHGISNNFYAPVTVQAMVYGNLDAESGAGVLIYRNVEGGIIITGEYSSHVQGPDIADGLIRPGKIHTLKEKNPRVYNQLLEEAGKLSACYFVDPEIEFTVSGQGQLWFLQVSREAHRKRIAWKKLSVEGHKPAGRGIGVYGGGLRGKVIFDASDITSMNETAQKEGLDGAIMVMNYPLPSDTGLITGKGLKALLTAKGGIGSHGASIARGDGIYAILGIEELFFDVMAGKWYLGNEELNKGDLLSLDARAERGYVYRGLISCARVSSALESPRPLPYRKNIACLKIAESSSPLEEKELGKLLSGIISCMNNSSQAGLADSVDSLGEFLLKLPLDALRESRFYNCLLQALKGAASKTDLAVLKNDILKLINNAIAVKIKLLPRDSNEYQRYTEALFYLTLPYVKKALKIRYTRPFEDLMGEFYPILLSSIAGYNERKGGNFPAYYSCKLKNDAKKRKFDAFTYVQGAGKDDGGKESYFEIATGEKITKEYISSAREEGTVWALSRKEIDTILDELWGKNKEGIKIVLALGEERVSRFDGGLLEDYYKRINEFRGENRTLNWKKLTEEFPALKDLYRAKDYFIRPLYVLFILWVVYKDRAAKSQRVIAKRSGLSSRMVNIYINRDIRPLLMNKIMGMSIDSAKKQLTDTRKKKRNEIQRNKDYLNGKLENINLPLIRSAPAGNICFRGLNIYLPVAITGTNKKIKAAIRRYTGKKHGKRVFVITVYIAGSKKEKLGHCLCRNVKGKLISLNAKRYVNLTLDTERTIKEMYINFFLKLRKKIILMPPVEAMEARTYKTGYFYLKGIDNVFLNLPCHKYSLTIIGANETSVIAEFASLDRSGHKEWKVFSGRGIDKSVACRWGIAAIKEGNNALIFYPNNNKQQAISFTLTPSYRKSRELGKETSPPARLAVLGFAERRAKPRTGEAGSPLEEIDALSDGSRINTQDFLMTLLFLYGERAMIILQKIIRAQKDGGMSQDNALIRQYIWSALLAHSFGNEEIRIVEKDTISARRKDIKRLGHILIYGIIGLSETLAISGMRFNFKEYKDSDYLLEVKDGFPVRILFFKDYSVFEFFPVVDNRTQKVIDVHIGTMKKSKFIKYDDVTIFTRLSLKTGILALGGGRPDISGNKYQKRTKWVTCTNNNDETVRVTAKNGLVRGFSSLESTLEIKMSLVWHRQSQRYTTSFQSLAREEFDSLNEGYEIHGLQLNGDGDAYCGGDSRCIMRCPEAYKYHWIDIFDIRNPTGKEALAAGAYVKNDKEAIDTITLPLIYETLNNVSPESFEKGSFLDVLRIQKSSITRTRFKSFIIAGLKLKGDTLQIGDWFKRYYVDYPYAEVELKVINNQPRFLWFISDKDGKPIKNIKGSQLIIDIEEDLRAQRIVKMVRSEDEQFVMAYEKALNDECLREFLRKTRRVRKKRVRKGGKIFNSVPKFYGYLAKNNGLGILSLPLLGKIDLSCLNDIKNNYNTFDGAVRLSRDLEIAYYLGYVHIRRFTRISTVLISRMLKALGADNVRNILLSWIDAQVLYKFLERIEIAKNINSYQGDDKQIKVYEQAFGRGVSKMHLASIIRAVEKKLVGKLKWTTLNLDYKRIVILREAALRKLEELRNSYNNNEGQVRFYEEVFPGIINEMHLETLYTALPQEIKDALVWRRLKATYKDVKMLMAARVNLEAREVIVKDLIYFMEDIKGFKGFESFIKSLQERGYILSTSRIRAVFLSCIPDDVRDYLRWSYTPGEVSIDKTLGHTDGWNLSQIIISREKEPSEILEEEEMLLRVKEALGQQQYDDFLSLLTKEEKTAEEKVLIKATISKIRDSFKLSNSQDMPASSPLGEVCAYLFRRYLLRSTMISDSFISDGLSLSSKHNSILWISSIASGVSKRGLNTIIPGWEPKGYKIRLPKSKSLVIMTAFSWMAVFITVPLVAEALPNSWIVMTAKPEFLSSFTVLPNTHSSRRNRILTRGFHFFKEVDLFILHQLVGVSNTGADIGNGNLGKVILAGNLLWFYASGQEVKYLPNHDSVAFYAGFSMADVGAYGDVIKQIFHNKTITIDTAKSQDYLRVVADWVADFNMDNDSMREKSAASPLEGGISEKFILVVENNNKQRRRFKKILKELGCKIVSAHNGEQAWDILKNEWKKISLVITDLDMPRLEGERFIRRVRGHRVRRHPQASRVKIMVISRRDFNEDKFGSEIDHYVLKPKLKPSVLKQIIVERFKLSSSALISSERIFDFTGGQGISYGCYVRTGVKTEEVGGYSNFIEVFNFRVGIIYPAIDKSYKNIFGLKSAVLFSHSTRVFCRGPPGAIWNEFLQLTCLFIKSYDFNGKI